VFQTQLCGSFGPFAVVLAPVLKFMNLQIIVSTDQLYIPNWSALCHNISGIIMNGLSIFP
jgi:hypothetical protein